MYLKPEASFVERRQSVGDKTGATSKKRVYRFKITLEGIRPPIWRRIMVPEGYSFWDLHVAIQDAMGWFDCHLHEFRIVNPKNGFPENIGIPDDVGFSDDEILPGWRNKIKGYFTAGSRKAEYVYDFGDDWRHVVELEGMFPAEPDVKYPCCLKGKRACPPEDCGGEWGYAEFLEKIPDPDHEERKELLAWLGREFDPEHFNPDEVEFSDPAERFRIAFQGE
jgi:hypothetical protein